VSIPRIRSERPAFDLHHPELAVMDQPARADIVDSVVGTSSVPAGDAGDRTIPGEVQR
jgi:cytochrome c oxidase subunit 1